MTKLRSLLVLSLCLTLAGCGGGASTPTPMPMPVPADDGGVPVEPDAGAPEPMGDGGVPLEEVDPFTVSEVTRSVVVGRGESAALRVALQRAEHFSGAVEAAMEDLPSGVTASITDEGAELAIELVADVGATVGDTTATLRVSGGELEVERPIAIVVPDWPGMVDASFGTAGELSLEGTVEHLVVDAAGRMLVTYASAPGTSVRLARLLRDGTPDPAWSTAPIVLDEAATMASVAAIAALPEGGALVLATHVRTAITYAELIVLGDDGTERQRRSFDSSETAMSVAHHAGRALVLTRTGAPDVARVRAFQVDDLTAEPITRDLPSLLAVQLVVDASGRAYVLGRHDAAAVVVRLTAALEVDSSFAGGRFELAGLSPYDAAFRPDGTITVVGRATGYPQPHPVAVTLDEAGERVGAFGLANGVMVYDGIVGAYWFAAGATDGSVFVAGYQGSSALLLERVTTGGALDPSFEPSVLTGVSSASALAMLDETRIVVVFSDEDDSRIVRLWR